MKPSHDIPAIGQPDAAGTSRRSVSASVSPVSRSVLTLKPKLNLSIFHRLPLIRRVRLDISQVSADPRSRRRRTLHPDQRALPIAELAEVDAIYAYSFILTNLDVSTPDKAAVVEHWYRHRTSIENVFRDSKHGAALRHLPSGYVEVNTAWMWGALLAASMAGWLHQLTAADGPTGRLAGWGTREGKAMIATLRHRLIRVPARVVSHAGQVILRLPPGHGLLAEILARLRALPSSH